MIDPNPQEVLALEKAGQDGGAFVESLGQTDLARWTPAQWTAFIDCVVTAYLNRLHEAYADDPPF